LFLIAAFFITSSFSHLAYWVMVTKMLNGIINRSRP